MVQLLKCGNGIRCFAKFLYENNIINKMNFLIETLDGVKEVSLLKDNEVRVKLALPKIVNEESLKTRVDGLKPFNFEEVTGYIVSVGTMHAIIYLDENVGFDFKTKADEIQKHPIFLNQSNVNFVKAVDDETIYVKTYELLGGPYLVVLGQLPLHIMHYYMAK